MYLEPKKMSLIKAMMDFFGPDRKVTITELKDLTPEDREELKVMLEGVGYEIVAPQSS